MDQLEEVELTASRRPQFLPDEVEVHLDSRVSLLDTHDDVVKKSGRLQLTTHRLMYFSGDDFHKAIHLGRVSRFEKQGGLFKKDKVEVYFSTTPAHVTFVWNKGKHDTLCTRLEKKLKERKWVTKKMAPVKQGFSTRRAGIMGIERRLKKKDADQSATLNAAFTGDLDKLMEKADELVKIADAMSKKQLTDDESSEFRDMLVDVGIGSIVTKAATGHSFHMEVARQLCDFLQKALKRNKGMVTVTDAYCLYNRARGTDLISPDDMLKACAQFEPLRLPLSLKSFASGVKVILDKSRNAAETNERIIELCAASEGRGVSSVDVAQGLDVSVVLANILLDDAEDEGVVCVDDAEEGVFYFQNFFADAQPIAWQSM